MAIEIPEFPTGSNGAGNTLRVMRSRSAQYRDFAAALRTRVEEAETAVLAVYEVETQRQYNRARIAELAQRNVQRVPRG